MQQTVMQQTQPSSDSKAITPPITLEIMLVSGGLLVGEKDGVVTVATMGEAKTYTPVGCKIKNHYSVTRNHPTHLATNAPPNLATKLL